MLDAEKHHRRSTRCAGYDYRDAGAHFRTICTHQKKPVFGRIENGVVQLHPYGRIVVEEWELTAQVRTEVHLDAFVVMPDHFHAIVHIALDISPVGACGRMPCDRSDTLHSGSDIVCAASEGVRPHAGTNLFAPSRDLGALVNRFKGRVTRRINASRAERGCSPVQDYCERVIRDSKELDGTRRYIFENPSRWQFGASK
jgi:hypothetical protein